MKLDINKTPCWIHNTTDRDKQLAHDLYQIAKRNQDETIRPSTFQKMVDYINRNYKRIKCNV